MNLFSFSISYPDTESYTLTRLVTACYFYCFYLVLCIARGFFYVLINITFIFHCSWPWDITGQTRVSWIPLENKTKHEYRIASESDIRKWYHKLEFYFQTSAFYFIYKAVFPCKPIGLILVGITEDKHLAVLWWLLVHHSSCIINNLWPL